MSETRTPRLPVVALGAAVLAVAVSAIAAIIVLTRDGGAPSTSAATSGSGSGGSGQSASAVSTVIDIQVSARDAYELREQLEVVVDAGVPRGVRVKDAALAKTLGLEADDVILAISGRGVTREADVSDVLLRAGTMRASTLYAEIERDGARALVRWQLDGNLIDARRDALAASRSATGSTIGVLGSTGGPLPPNPFTDPDQLSALLDRVERIDDTHTRIPKKTFEALLANADTFSKGARVIPAMKNGVHDGYKLYAIRPASLYARVGLTNGDTVHAINGADLADVDDLVTLLVDARNKTRTFRLDLTRRGKPTTLVIEITP